MLRSIQPIRQLYVLAVIVCISGCAAIGAGKLESRFGKAEPRDRVVQELNQGDVDFWQDAKPIFDKRCVVCHGCYDAPCQLKLTSIEGIERGAHSKSVYNTTRLLPATLTRLEHDADTIAGWRDRGFFPALNEHAQSMQANREAGVMHQLLSLKERHPLPDQAILDDRFTFGLGRKESCPKPHDIDDYKRDTPLWGMPYALPGLTANEHNTLKKWIEQGATYTARADISMADAAEIELWEAFFNQNSLKGRLASRYMFEHLYLASLYFDAGQSSPRFFMLVRSATPPGEPVKKIATRRPYDDPEVERVYYRFVPETETIVDKSHLPYVLDSARMERWQSLFFDPSYRVTELPGYEPKVAANPFLSFAQLPMKSRYKFMLDEAQFTIMNYIKGPVCRGSVAVNVINDHFWVFFADPDLEFSDDISQAIVTHLDDLELPSAVGDSYLPIIPWKKYGAKERRNIKGRDLFYTEIFAEENTPFDLNLIWDGDGENENAALTVFRHWDSATVEKGLLGEHPKTAWVISYPLLERIHYLLVAGYDVYGNIGHNLLSRLHMDFLRMDGEAAFLMLLPQKARERERAFWYRDADDDTLDFLRNPEFERRVDIDIQYETDNSKRELYQKLHMHLSDVLPSAHDISAIGDPTLSDHFSRLASFKGKNTRFLSEMSAILVADDGGDHGKVFTLLKNNAHRNVTVIFGESQNLLPKENTVTVVRGLVGAYPNTFFKVNLSDVGEFVDRLSAITSEDDYASVLDRFGVRRTNARFWEFSDQLHATLKHERGAAFGFLDFNRIENR